MKVEQSGLNRINKPENEGSVQPDKISRAYEANNLSGISGTDKATLSEQARLLSKAFAKAEETPEVRQERVNELRQQIETGNYEIPVKEIAKRLYSQFKVD